MPKGVLDLQEVLQKSVLRVIEQLTFMFGDPVAKEELDIDGHKFVKAEMTFSGDQSGRICIAVPFEATTEIAANILGLEPEDHQSQEMTEDALGELLNVVCGHVVRDLSGAGANFTLHPPVTEELSATDMDSALLRDEYLGFELEDYPGLFGLMVED